MRREFQGVEKMMTLKIRISNWILPFVLLAILFAPAILFGHSKECGLEGSVEERIEDCQRLKNSTKIRNQKLGAFKSKPITWRLVSRLRDHRFDVMQREVWFNEDTRLVWSDRMVLTRTHKGSLTYENAVRACENPEWARESKANLDLDFRLPNLQDFKIAHAQGLKDVIKGVGQGFSDYSGPESVSGIGTIAIYEGYAFWTLDLFEKPSGELFVMIYNSFPFPIFHKDFFLTPLEAQYTPAFQALCIAKLD
jgi:hypothetical protein